MTDIVLEGIQAVVLLTIVAFLWNAGRDRFEQSRKGWNLIISGFGLLLLASILEIIDDFEPLNRLIGFGSTDVEAEIQKFVGFLGGFVLLAVGFWVWIPKVQVLSDLVDTRTRELQESNGALLTEINNRLQAEAILRRSEERFRSLTANTNIIPWEADATTFQFTYVGPQAEHHPGYPADDWYRHDFWPAHIHPDDKEMAIATCMSSLERGEDSDFEYRMIAADGRTVWLRDFVNVVVNEGGNKLLRGILVNITSRKNVETSLKESEERYRALVECASDAFFLHDQDGKLIEVNDAACQSLGYERDELLTKQVSDFERGVDPAVLRKAWASMSEGEAFTVQGEHHRKDGSRFPIEARVSLLIVDGDKRFLALVRDTTDRRQAELAVRESEAQYRTLVETSHDLIWSVDLEGRFTFVNQAARAIHGYEPAEMIGRRFTDFMTEEQAEKGMAAFSEIKSGKNIWG